MPSNIDVQQVKERVLTNFFGTIYEYKIVDTVAAGDDQIVCPPENLNSQDPSSPAPTSLKLRIGRPIMLLRNFDSAHGLCNGTRLICGSFQRYVIEAEIITGINIAAIVPIPRISLLPSEERTPI